MANRTATIKRETRETNVSVQLNLDGSGRWEMNTGLRMLDHLLSQLAQHGVLDLKISANSNDSHHLVEDVAICLGRAFSEALGTRQGITRMADATVPMDDTLVQVALDISGRGYHALELNFSDKDIGGLPSDLVRHFLESFAIEARMNLHARVLYGVNDHHKAEALFKALGRVLDRATRLDERLSDKLPSTKNVLEH